MIQRIFLLVLFISSLFLFGGKAAAQILLRYPVAELGYCRDAKECYFYCEIPQNKAACWSYGTYKLGFEVLGVTTLSAEEKAAMEAKARELGITFPIAELGSCAGPEECRNYCENPSNQQVCMSFAKKHGFDKGESQGGQSVDEQEILQAAKAELGCTSKESCHAVCERDHERCMAFARKHGMYRQESEYQGGVDKEKLIGEGQKELGCSSMESCARVCEQDQQRCIDFAKRHGAYREGREDRGRETEQRSGAGGCDNEESCRRYCSEHSNECPGYQQDSQLQNQQYNSQSQEEYVGPTGCRTASECEQYCKSNPSQCPGYTEAQPKPSPTSTSPDPSQWCTQQSGCSWTGTYCNCGNTSNITPTPY